MSIPTLEVKLEHLEHGGFTGGLHYYADRSGNHRIRLESAKVVRQIERKTKEPFNDHQDIIRAYGKKNKDGILEVTPSNLTKEEADAYEKTITEWRGRTITLESDLFEVYKRENGEEETRLKIKLPEEDMNKLPYFCYGALLDYTEFEVDKTKGETEVLRERVAQLESQVKTMKKGEAEAPKG